METVLSYKYPVGTKVYYKDFGYESIDEDCHICNGEGVLLRKDKSQIKCPSCGGSKIEQSSKRQVQTVKEGVVSYVVAEIRRRGTQITYYLEDLSQFNEEKLFSTKEEARESFKVNRYDSILRWEGFGRYNHEYDY